MGICTGHFDADMQQLNPILDFTEASLARLHISDKTARMARFQAEDVLKSLIRSAAAGARIEVRVSHFLGRAQIQLIVVDRQLYGARSGNTSLSS